MAQKRANAKHFAESTGRIQQRACIILDFVKKKAPMRRLCRHWMKVLLRTALLANCRFGIMRSRRKEIYRVIKDEEHYREQLWKTGRRLFPVDIELYREIRGFMMEKADRSCGNESFRLFVIFRAETSCWKRKSCMIVSWILFCKVPGYILCGSMTMCWASCIRCRFWRNIDSS
mgnify:CR=1 FL=1